MKTGKKSKEIDTTRVIINVPTKLLKAFDDVCESQSYQRTEGIKEAMRAFVNAEAKNLDAYDPNKTTQKQMENMAKLIQELQKTSTKNEFYKKMK